MGKTIWESTEFLIDAKDGKYTVCGIFDLTESTTKEFDTLQGAIDYALDMESERRYRTAIKVAVDHLRRLRHKLKGSDQLELIDIIRFLEDVRER